MGEGIKLCSPPWWSESQLEIVQGKLPIRIVLWEKAEKVSWDKIGTNEHGIFFQQIHWDVVVCWLIISLPSHFE